MNLYDPSTLCFILLAVIAALLTLQTRARLAGQRKRWADEETRSRGSDSAGLANSASAAPRPRDLAEWEVEMHETARRLSAQIDAKLSLLQSLIAEADRAAERLEEAWDRAHPALPPGSQADSLRPTLDAGRDLREAESALEWAGSTVAEEVPPPGDRGRRRDEIYRLADYGFAAREIARRVGSPAGEVELILSLREK